MDRERREGDTQNPAHRPAGSGRAAHRRLLREEEIEVVVRTIRDSMDPNEGFGFICEEIEQFERRFGDYCNAAHCVSITGAAPGWTWR